MSKEEKGPGRSEMRHLRIWPAVILLSLQLFLRFILPAITPTDAVVSAGVLAGMAGGLLLGIWWLFFSRAGRGEKWTAAGLVIGVMGLTFVLTDSSITTGFQGLMFPVLFIPVISTVFVMWAVVFRRFPADQRRMLLVSAAVLTGAGFTLIRSNGITGQTDIDFDLRWAQTAEEKLLDMESEPAENAVPETREKLTGEWIGFRGSRRDSTVSGTSLKTDWNSAGPELLWRRPVGPGCSSFAVKGTVFFTQEQRGEDEAVSCYDLTTGIPVWMHTDKARFYDSHAGAGPRSTPAVHEGRVYSLGATGILNALNAEDGSVLWSRNAALDTQVKIPPWGLCSSPLAAGDRVIVSAVGALAGYDCLTGELKWTIENQGKGYSSPHYLNIDGAGQVLLMSSAGAVSAAPEDGTVLWKYSWKTQDRIVQPALIDENNLLLSGSGNGMQRVNVRKDPEGWKTELVWTGRGIKPSWNDFVIHKGYAYGFTGPYFACMDLKNGKRVWRGERYAGHLLLLTDQDMIIVLSEKGEIALVQTLPGGFRELGKIQGIEGKTWNLPVLLGNVLLVRNAVEMAAYLLPAADKGTES